MNTLSKYSGVLAVVAVLIAIIAPQFDGNSFGNVTQSFWDTANGYRVDGTAVIDGDGSLIIGTNGTTVTDIITGTCNLSQNSAGSHAATTSMEYYCAVTGVTSGDQVFVSLPQGAGAYAAGGSSPFGGFTVNTAFATTSNVIGVSVYNGTGAATTSAAQATTSVQYLILGD